MVYNKFELMLLFAIVTITLALFWYSIAVWAEKFSARLKEWHVVFFWIGFVSDATGTVTMSIISKGFLLDIHGISGPVALLLMLFHASWATVVIIKKNEKLISNFHKFSMFVWMIWLIPYITGIVMHMR
jgi:uncharacterized repeat protein (TIGR03987 family)